MAKTLLECWSCIMDDEIMGIIVQQTNQYIESIKSLFKRDRDAKPTDIVELKAFIGLLYLAGVHRGNRQSLEDLWGSDWDGIEKFRLVMNIKRFKFIMRCMRFDDRSMRNERRKIDKIAAIRDIFTMFVKNSQKSYSLGQNVTIDEKLEGFRGRCGFVQYISNKPNKYGVKIYALVDSQVYCVYNLEIYAGLQPEGPFRLNNSPSDVVLRLCQPIYQTGRNVTADNWFTSIPLIDELRSKKISYVGTLKKNKIEIPLEFLPNKTRVVNSSLFAFKKGCTLVSYVPKKGKSVILASSLHEDNSIDLDIGDKKKPCIITFYNGTKGGVDTADKLCASFNVARNIRRWPMVVFFAMLNISGINAQVIYFGNDQNVIRRKAFLKALSHALVLPHMARRSLETSGIHTGMQQRLKEITPVDQEQQKEENENVGKRKRCHTCIGQRRLTKYNCKKCKKPICLMHIECFCNNCSQILSEIPQDDIDEGMLRF
ncbi:piggyBac transposable element-derived protein 4-like [Onthophagus taurus]|uniref:piggyBac transposable element-derived protein 4-like n=1 Tax=Onthophagus taurus TaxID=166361 RepID=UPI0039BE9B73